MLRISGAACRYSIRQARFKFDNDFALKKKPIASIPTKEELLELIENAPPASTNVEMTIKVDDLAKINEKSTFIRPSFGEIFKLNRDPNRIPHGFITNQNCSPLVFLQEISEMGWYKYNIVQKGDFYLAKDLERIDLEST